MTRQQAALATLALLAASPLHAEEWKHEMAPYLWGAAMDGSSGVGPVIADVDVAFSDILDNLEAGFMGMYRASRDGWSITADFVYMGLGVTKRGPGGRIAADIDLDQTALELDIGRELTENFTVFGGLRYNDLSAEVKATGPLGNVSTADGDESWVDPLIGAHYTIPFSDAWSLTLRGDVGGFGVGSAAELAWQAIATVRWQFTPNLGALAAYRYMDVDYEDGEGRSYFKLDIAISGPALGIVFTF